MAFKRSRNIRRFFRATGKGGPCPNAPLLRIYTSAIQTKQREVIIKPNAIIEFPNCLYGFICNFHFISHLDCRNCLIVIKNNVKINFINGEFQ